MKVVLQANWAGPQGYFFYKGKDGEPVEIPEEFIDQLPKSAKIVDENYKAPDPVESIVRPPVADEIKAFFDPQNEVEKAIKRRTAKETK